jgi:hypothetical protein
MAFAAPALAIAGKVGTVVGTGMSIYGALKGGQSASQSAQYDANQNAQNAITARRQADVEALRVRRRGAQVLGDMRASYGASGVDGSQGTPLDVLEDSASQVELDALTEKYNGELQAIGFERSAALDIKRGKDAVSASKVGAVSALVAGLPAIASAFGK